MKSPSSKSLVSETSEFLKFTRTFEVTFGVAGSQNKWSANYRRDSFGDAELAALETLAQNDDRNSYIQKIELW